jgi:hypothetical protein
MKSWMVITAIVIGVRVAGAAEPGQPRTIHLEMKNEATAEDAVVTRAQLEVTRIFAQAGVSIRWTDTGPRFTVTIVPQVLGYARAGSPVMGVAVRKADGGTAQIFLKQVRNFSHEHRVDLGVLLAYVIAHELGHLLLPGTPHSATGVMRADWDRAIVHDAVNRSLSFTEAQAQRIRGTRRPLPM